MSDKTNIRLPELLAPAGSPDALDAAIEARADAVYFGAGDFNARMRAKNFTDDEMERALAKCAGYGIKTYVTVNTRLTDRELPEVVLLAERLWLCGASALIVADSGAASYIKERIPDFELHASTQLSCLSVEDAAALSTLGFSRMVCPREISLPELEYLCKNSPIEIEAFVHGAHCVSFSGQCLMSFAMGGRSGNRGMCAQPCRLPYEMQGVKNPYPISLSDMCLAPHIPELINCGVSSLKIEGRQKSADYVYGVVSIYRRLLDERRAATPDETARLTELFSRGGFTDGYLRGDYGNMLGVRPEDERTPDSGFSGLTRKVPVDAKLEVKVGGAPSLTFSDGVRSACATGAVCSKREGGVPMDETAAREKVGKLGATPFVLGAFSADIDPDAYFSLSELNSMRRECANLLTFPKPRSKADFKEIKARTSFKKNVRPVRTAEFLSFSQIPEEAFSAFDKIYIPLSEAERADGKRICLYLPPVAYDGGYPRIAEALAGYSGEVMVNTPGQALAVRAAGCAPVGSFRFNVTNSECAEVLSRLVDVIAISPEAPCALCRDIEAPCSVTVYGRLPLMLTERCAISDGGAVCPFGGAGGRSVRNVKKTARSAAGKSCDGTYCRAFLTDRTGARFPVVGLEDCSNIIYNSVPTYMADKKDFFALCRADRLHFVFTTETREECGGVIRAYINGTPPSGAVRRIK